MRFSQKRLDEGAHRPQAVFERRRNAVAKRRAVEKGVAARAYPLEHRGLGEILLDVEADFFFGFVGCVIQRKVEKIGGGDGGHGRNGIAVRHTRNQVRNNGRAASAY